MSANPWPEPFLGGRLDCQLWLNSGDVRYRLEQGTYGEEARVALTREGAKACLQRAKADLESTYGPASQGQANFSEEEPSWDFSWVLGSWGQFSLLMSSLVVPSYLGTTAEVPKWPFSVFVDPGSFRVLLKTRIGVLRFASEGAMDEEDEDLQTLIYASRALKAWPSPRGLRVPDPGPAAVRFLELCQERRR